MRTAFLALILMGGCLAAPPEPTRVAAVVTDLDLPACVRRYEAFVAEVEIVNEEAKPGVAQIVLYAQQYGRLATIDVALAPFETRRVRETVEFTVVGVWEVYVTSPDSRVGSADVRALGADLSCS